MTTKTKQPSNRMIDFESNLCDALIRLDDYVHHFMWTYADYRDHSLERQDFADFNEMIKLRANLEAELEKTRKFFKDTYPEWTAENLPEVLA